MKPKQKLAYILTVFCLLLVPLVALAGSRPSIGNITNTSVGAERVFVGDNGNLNAQTATGDTIGGFPVVITGQTFISSPVLADINSDGLKEISAVTQSPVDVGSGNRIYSLRFFSGSGVELASIELGSAPAYEPVVLVSSGQSKENILLSNSTGLVSLYTFQSSSTISATPFFDNGVLSWVTPNKFGNQIFVGSPTTSSINIYSKSGANWNLSKIFLTPNPVIFPALDDKAGRLYFVDSANDLWAINSVTGVGIAGFPVSLGGQAVDAPIFSDVDAVNADQEIVVALSSGQRAVITTAGVVLQKNLKQKSFLNFNNDANRTNGFYSLLNNNVGYTYDDATGEHRLASQYSNIRLNAPVMDAEVVLPGAMNGLSVTSTAGSLVLAWDQYSGNTIDHINIYRSTSSAVDIDASVLFTTVASTAVTYTDDSVSSSVPYYYSLVAVSFEGALGPVGEWVGPASAGPVIPTSVSFNLDESSGAQSFVGNVEGINILCLAGKCPTAGLPGISGNAIEFNGTNSYGYITDSDLLKPADQLTLEAWIKPEVNPGQSYHTVIAKYTYFLLTVSPAGDLRADITNASGTRVYFSAPNTITFSQWNHVVMTYDGAMIRLYANGVKVGEKAQTGNVSTVSSDVSIGSTNGSADMFKGLIDEAKIYKRVLSDIEIQDSFASMNFTPVIATHLSFSYSEPVGATQFFDQSLKYAMRCPAGKCPTAGLPGISGNAIGFNGTSTFGYIVDNNFTKPQDQFTVEAWIKPEYNPGQTYYTILNKNNFYDLTIRTDGSLQVGVINTSSTQVYMVLPNVITFSQWNHIAMTYDGAIIQVYVNGVKVGEKTQTGWIKQNTTNVYIGSPNGSVGFYKGMIDEVKFHDSVLSAAEVAESFGSVGFTPVVVNELSFSFSEDFGSSRFLDTSKKYSINCSANKCPTAGATGISGNAIQLNGTSSYGYIMDSDLTKPNDQLTLEAWVKPELNPGQSYHTVIAKFTYFLLTISNNGDLRADITNSSGTRVYFSVPNAVAFAQWNHLAMTYDGAMIRLYVNGVKVGEKIQTGNVSTVTSNINIGSTNGSADMFKGLIDEAKIYKRVLTDSEIQASFASLNFTPNMPSNLSFSFSEPAGSNTFLDSSGVYSVRCSANKCPTAGAIGISGNAIQLNGTSSYGYTLDSNLVRAQDQLTVEAWIKPEFNPSQPVGNIIGKLHYYTLMLYPNGDLRADITNSADSRVYVIVSNVISFSQWNHIAMTYDGSVIRLYVNGVKVGEKVQTGIIKQTAHYVYFGSANGSVNYFKGLIDEAKIYKRVLTDSEIQDSFASMNLAPNITQHGNIEMELGSSAEALIGTSTQPTDYYGKFGEFTLKSMSENSILSRLDFTNGNQTVYEITLVKFTNNSSTVYSYDNTFAQPGTSNFVGLNVPLNSAETKVEVYGKLYGVTTSTTQVTSVENVVATGADSMNVLPVSGLPLQLPGLAVIVQGGGNIVTQTGSIEAYINDVGSLDIHNGGDYFATGIFGSFKLLSYGETAKLQKLEFSYETNAVLDSVIIKYLNADRTIEYGSNSITVTDPESHYLAVNTNNIPVTPDGTIVEIEGFLNGCDIGSSPHVFHMRLTNVEAVGDISNEPLGISVFLPLDLQSIQITA